MQILSVKTKVFIMRLIYASKAFYGLMGRHWSKIIFAFASSSTECYGFQLP